MGRGDQCPEAGSSIPLNSQGMLILWTLVSRASKKGNTQGKEGRSSRVRGHTSVSRKGMKKSGPTDPHSILLPRLLWAHKKKLSKLWHSTKFPVGLTQEPRVQWGVLREGWPWNSMIPPQEGITGFEPWSVASPHSQNRLLWQLQTLWVGLYHCPNCGTQLSYIPPLQIKPIRPHPTFALFKWLGEKPALTSVIKINISTQWARTRTEMKKVLPLMHYTRRWRWWKDYTLMEKHLSAVPYHALINWVKCLSYILKTHTVFFLNVLKNLF